MRCEQQQGELGAHAGRALRDDLLRDARGGLLGPALELESELCHEACRAQRAQRILGEARIGVARCAQHGGGEVGEAAVRIEQHAVATQRQRVEGEVAVRELTPTRTLRG